MWHIPYLRKWKYLVLPFVIIIAASFLWYSSNYVRAFITIKRTHVPATSVSAKGWSDAEKTLMQDLAADAGFSSFDRSNSASVMLEAMPAEETPAPSPEPEPPVSGPEPAEPVAEDGESGEVPVPAEPEDEIPGEENAATSTPEEVPAPIQEDTVPEAQTEPDPVIATSSAPELPDEPAEEPSVESIETETEGEAETASSTAVRSSGIGTFERYFERVVDGVAEAFAPYAFASTTENPSGSTTMQTSTAPLPDAVPPDVAACSVTGKPCYTIELSGFRVNETLMEKRLDSVEVNFSFASMMPASDIQDDRLLVRYFHDGSWRDAGEIYLNKEFSNASNGGYFTSVLEDIDDWADLSDIRVVLEYERNGSGRTELYLDSAWIDVLYKDRPQDLVEDILDTATDEEDSQVLPAEPDAPPLSLEGGAIEFPYVDDLDEDTLVMRANRLPMRSNDGAGPTAMYISVTNEGRSKDTFPLSVALPRGSRGTLSDIAQYVHNVPIIATSTESLEEETRYESTWVSMPFSGDEEAEDAREVRTEKEFEIHPGQTLYFRAAFSGFRARESFVMNASGARYSGDLSSDDLRDESEWRAGEDEEPQPQKKRVNDQLSKRAEFDGDELPEFKFRFKSQRNIIIRSLNRLLRRDSFAVERAELRHAGGKTESIPVNIAYEENGEWTLQIQKRPRAFRPGKYEINVTVAEGGSEYTDVIEFYWGVLAVNTNKSVYEPGEDVHLMMAALDDAGNTICDAILDLSIARPSGVQSQIPVRTSGECGPNNVVDVADYLADTTAGEIGTYAVTLTHRMEDGSVLHRINDAFEVQERVPFVVERSGPTRIFPKAPYVMNISIRAKAAFAGRVTEALPIGTIVVDADGGVLEQYGDALRLSWDVELEAGEERRFRYEFDSPDISPYLYIFGPLILTDDGEAFRELRSWKIASDALGSYIEKHSSWSPTVAGSWEAKSLASSPYNVPANAIVEIAVVNSDINDAWIGGMRHASSSLSRTFNIHEAEPQGTTEFVMHVQASATSSIQTFAEDTTGISFILIGYWTNGYYIERFDQIDPGITNNTWGSINLNSFGVASGTVAEMVVGNFDGGTELVGGIRASTTLTRSVEIHESEGPAGASDGMNGFTAFVKATSSNATVQGFAEVEGANNASIDYFLIGYWNSNPTGLDYTEKFSDIGGPASGSTWTDVTLSTYGVSSSGIAEVLFADTVVDNSSVIFGVRTDASSIDRTFNIHETEGGGGGTQGWSVGKAHVKAGSDANATIEFYTDNTAADAFRLLGFWSASNTPPNAPALYDYPFESEKTGTSTPKIRFSATDPDGSSDILYQIQWDDDAVLDDAPIGDRTSSDESGCSPNCFQDLSTSDTSPFNEGDQIEFTIQTALVSGTTYYWRVRATDVTGSHIESEWSTTTSFTYVANTDPSQWLQTQDAQFDLGVLTSTETYGSNTVRLAASAPTGALITYGEGTVQTPRYRTWTGSAWSAEGSAQDVGGIIEWMSLKAGTTRDEYVLGTQDASGDVNVQVYNGTSTTWGYLQEVTQTIPDITNRGFDVAYETTSGDALVVYCDGDADPSYYVWNGNSWTGPGTVDLTGANNCEWIKLASDPVSDEIIVVSRDTAAGATDYEALVWDGSAWADSIRLGADAGELGHEGIALEYEESGNQAVVAVSNGAAAATALAWVVWDGSDWSFPSTEALGNDFEWGILKRDAGSDNMALCYADQSDDLGILRWDGSGWQAFQEYEDVTNVGGTGTPDGRSVSCEFETTAGRDGYIMIPSSSDTAALYQYWDGTTMSGASAISTIQDSWTIGSARTGAGKILTFFHDDQNSRYDFSYWDGSSWSTIQTIENTPSDTTDPFSEPITMAAQLYQSSSGTILSDPIDFDWVPAQPTWGGADFSTTEPSGTNVLLQVLSTAGSSCSTLIPDGALPGNSSGFDISASPVNLSALSTSTYNRICLKATLSSTNQNVPTLTDWTVSWEPQPYLSQSHYRWYANAAAITPTDPWPSGATDLGEDTAMTAANPPSFADVLRLRMAALVENVNLNASALTLKLQYASGATCSADMTWRDVGAIGSTTAKWRGYDNASVADAATLPSVVLSSSDTRESYEEANDSVSNPFSITTTNEGEWDWVIQHNASSSESYCFRAITAEGEILNEYDVYPALVTNVAPGTPTLEKPFDNEAVGTTTPWFEFVADDPESNDLTYQIQVDNDYDFSSTVFDTNSQISFNDFSNVVTPSDKDPFNSGQTVRFIPTSTITNNTTYYWRVRAKDRNASTDWSGWSSIQSFTASTSATITTWHQTRLEQFAADSHDDTEATSTHDAVLTPPLTVGTTTGSTIDFDWKTTGNAWGELRFTDDETSSDIKYGIEYLSGSTWSLIPDTDLSGNAAGFDTSPVSLLGLSPTTYNQIRVRAILTNAGATPRLNDWTIAWGEAVEQPTLTALFDNEKTGTTTPSYRFFSTDPQDDDLEYEISFSLTTDFAASTTRRSGIHVGFTNTASTTDVTPFVAGDSIRFTLQQADALTNGNTYWWRVRARDPSGGNTWSTWSSLRSFTVDTSVVVSTWFQTTDAQFNTDTLNDTETNGSGSARVTTTIREAFVAYAEGTVQAPRYKIWNGTAWGSEQTGVTTGVGIRFVETAAAPTRDEYVIATEGSNGIVRAQTFNGTTETTGNLADIISAVPDATQRGFDIAYETSSGDAMVAACSGTEAVYRIWNGTGWAATSSISLSTTGNCEWIKLASDPTSDEIILVTRNDTTGVTDYEALVWNGSAWNDSMTMGSQVAVNDEGIAIEYEESGGQAIVAVANGANNNFIWNSWNGSGWLGASTVGAAIGNDFAVARMARDVGSDNMALCYMDIDEDMQLVTWNGSAWTVQPPEFETLGNAENGRALSCEFETTAGRDGYVMIPYTDQTIAEYQYWNGSAYVGPTGLTTIGDSWEVRTARTGDGNILAVAYDDGTTEYDFTYWNGSAWSTEEILETSSITTVTPATIPIDIVARRYPSFTSGTVISSSIDFDDGSGPKWELASWNDTTTGGSDVLYQVEYFTSTSSWAFIPESEITGNGAGTTTSPINLGNIDKTTYNTLRLKANLACGASCPTLNDWTLAWSEGIDVSGTMQEFDQSTNVTSGTVAVAVNDEIQIGKTGTISGGTWTIPNVTVFSGDVVTVFVDGGSPANRAVGVAKYDGSGDISGMNLYERHLSIGSSDNQTVTNADLGQFDNSVSGDADIFHEVDGGNDLAVCHNVITGDCFQSELWIKAHNTYRPDSASGGDVATRHIEINGTVMADGNTIRVSGSWDNNGTTTANTSTIVFTATSTTESVDSTGAIVASFNNVTFGQTSGAATWNLASTLDINGNLSMQFGTLAMNGNNPITIAGNLTIGSSGLYAKGSATTTFDGSGTSNWTDNSSSKQDLGQLLVDGTVKTLTLASDVKATNVTIGADDTLNAGGTNALEVLGNWTNNNVFTAQTGTVNFTSTVTGRTILPGGSSFYNLAFNGAGGNWAFSGSTVTAGNNLTISNGTLTLPTATTTVGGSFNVTNGTFMHNNGVVLFNGSGATSITASTSSFYDLNFEGSGTRVFSGNATSSRHTTITASAVTLPSGILAVGGSFVNSGGTVTHNSGTLKLTATTAQTVRLNGSSAHNLTFAGSGGSWGFTDANATSTNAVRFENGAVTLPSNSLAVGGSWTVTSGSFVHNNGVVRFNSTDAGETIDPGLSNFHNLIFDGIGGGWTITGNATSTASTTITRAASFTANSGISLAVSGQFTNLMGGATTTWTGSTLFLNSSTAYSLNASTTGADAYGTLIVAANTDVRMWNSSASVTNVDSSGSLYSQDHAAVDGDLYIWGEYVTTNNEYWSYATDFDGTVLGSPRQVDVRIAGGSSIKYSSSTLAIVGIASATTTIANQGSGSFAMNVNSAYLNAQYYNFTDTDTTGLWLTGSTSITSLARGDFTLSTNAGSSMTVESSVIDRNPGIQIQQVRFATSTGVSGSNVRATSTPVSYWWFRNHYGNHAGEAFDNDVGGNPGHIRWDDSNISITVSGNVYSDHGFAPIGNPPCDGSTAVVRIVVTGILGSSSYSGSCSAGTGAFSIPSISFNGDVVVTTYLNTNGGRKAVTVTKTPSADITDLRLYENTLVVRHEDVGSITIADLASYDSSDDTDIFFSAATGSPDTLMTEPNTELYVWSGKTFAPSGNIALQSGGSGDARDGRFFMATSSTFVAAGSESHSIGGGFTASSSATFTSANSAFTFAATTSGKTIWAEIPVTFYNLTFDGSGGAWSLVSAATTTISNAFSMTAGSLGGTGNIAANSGSLTGNGTIAMTGGTVQLLGTGNLGSNTAWQFNNLTLGGGSVGTTTKTGVATTTVLSVLRIASNQVLEAGSGGWDLAGAGTPFIIGGTFRVQSAPFTYSANGATSITRGTYASLIFAPSSAGNPTFTLLGGSNFTASSTTVGGANPVTVDANTNDPSITVTGNVSIGSGSTLIASNTGAFDIGGSWLNSGTFTHSSGTVLFNSGDTGETINASTSPFHVLTFDGASGGWTISGNATSSNNLSLSAASSFTVSSGSTLAVGGAFTNGVGGGATTWTGSTLYLHSGTNYSINTKTAGGDAYGTLLIGTNTDVRAWNSSATTATVNPTGSLYSQDHAAVDGDLYVWGEYVRSTGSDYWSYATDFDGTALGGSSRQVDVRIATSSSVTLSGGVLDILGSASASTTIAVQGAGQYAFDVTGGTLNANYYQIRDLDFDGLNLSGSPIITSLSYGDFELVQSGGSMMTVTGTVIDANVLKIFFQNRFATSSGVTSGTNVKATGSSASSWKFNLHYGNLAGESFDDDPGGDPGLIRWDDSANDITISGNVYSDEGSTVSSICNGSAQVVSLKVQGAGSYAVSCAAGTGAYSIPGVSFNPGDVLTAYLDTGGGQRAANISVDPNTNIASMHLYENRVIVRHEDTAPLTIADMAIYDSDEDADIPFDATDAGTDTLALPPDTKLIVWTAKTFAPAGNITLESGGSGSAWDGTLELYATSTFSAAGSQSHSVGGNLTLQSGANIESANSTFTFTATTTGKTIMPQAANFYNIVFNGTGGNWAFSGASATSTNDFTITMGTVTLPTGTTTVGGSFQNTGGAFMHNNGRVVLTATSGGKNVRGNGNNFYNMTFNGSGGAWTMQDSNATSSNNFIISAGSVTAPTGVLSVGSSFQNAGAFTHSSGTLKLTATAAGKVLQAGGSDLYDVLFNGIGGEWTWNDTNATTSNDLVLVSGSTTLPGGTLAIGGSLSNGGAFAHNNGTVRFNASAAGKTIFASSSPFYNLALSGSGGWTITGSATSTNNFSLFSASNFTLSSGAVFTVGGTFTNLVGGTATTWTGSTLYINSGATTTINTKTAGGDLYDGTLRVGGSTDIRIWNSAATTTIVDATASLYSQDHGGVDGDLYIWGEYVRSTGSDYWSYATDFDGTALGGSSRQVDVRIATSSSVTLSGGTLAIIGTAVATTTIEVQAAGQYALDVTGGTLNANYYRLRNFDFDGLNLSGSPIITSLSYGDFELVQSGGSMMTVTGAVIDANASMQISGVHFGTSSAVSAGFNVMKTSASTGAWTFTGHYGNYDGEAFDSDGGDACGYIRWSDSSCLFVSQEHFRWRNDDGSESVPNSEWYNGSWSKRKRVTFVNTTDTTLTNIEAKITVAYDSDMQSDFDDLRFTDSSGTTSVDYWVEEYAAGTTATVWIEIPSLPASGSVVAYMYYGNAGATNGGYGTTTFDFFDDFEDDNITEYSGNTSLFNVGTSFNHNYAFGLDAAGNEDQKTTGGLYRTGALVTQGNTLRFYQYVDATQDDEPCTLFGVQGSGQNYAVCLDQYPIEKVTIAKDVISNEEEGSGAWLASTTVTYATGWYEVEIDWLLDDSINVTVYEDDGDQFATVNTSDSSYSSGGVGFSYWFQNGGWDFYSARTYVATDPTYIFGLEQGSGGATWKAAEDVSLTAAAIGENVRLRFSIENSGAPLFGQLFRLQYAQKGASLSCEAVPFVTYNDVPAESGGCGSAPACMATSSQFTDQTDTTPLLSATPSMTFNAGKMVEDPSNQTASSSIPNSNVTEVEYNFKMTTNATESVYCFRTSKGGVDLDNYDNVADVQMSHAPFISNFALNNGSNITLTEGATSTVMATGTVTDFNGYADIVSATSTIYRSEVGAECGANENSCYRIDAPQCTFSDCSGNSCTLSCRADLQYFADPTDPGSTYAAQNWVSYARVLDSGGLGDSETSLGVDVYSLFGLSASTSINYGSISAGENTGATNTPTLVANTGNTNIDIELEGTDLTGSGSTIDVDEQKYATTTFAYSGCSICNLLTGSPVHVEVDLPKPSSTSTPVTTNVYWGINIPTGTGATSHLGTNTFWATSE